jgi:hypothetical protein
MWKFLNKPSNFMLTILVASAIAIVAGNVVMPDVDAQHGQSGKFSNVFNTHAYEELDSTTGVVKVITSGIIDTTFPDTSQRAYIAVSGQNIRFLCDGTTPTTSLGNPVSAGAWFQVVGLSDIQNFKFINDDDTGTATCHINLQYEGEMNE